MKGNLQQQLKIGQLDRRITLQSRSDATDDYGGTVMSWTDIATVWAKVDWGTGSEKEGDIDVLRAVTDVDFVIRYRTDAKDKRMRVSYDSKYYDVKSVAEIGRKRFLKLRAKLIE